MTRHIHFDEDKVRQACERLRAGHAKNLDKPGFIGAQARIYDAIALDFHLALSREANRGTGGVDIAKAVAVLLANISLSWITSVTAPESSSEERMAAANNLMLLFGSAMEHGLIQLDGGNVGMEYVRSDPVGRA